MSDGDTAVLEKKKMFVKLYEDCRPDENKDKTMKQTTVQNPAEQFIESRVVEIGLRCA